MRAGTCPERLTASWDGPPLSDVGRFSLPPCPPPRSVKRIGGQPILIPEFTHPGVSPDHQSIAVGRSEDGRDWSSPSGRHDSRDGEVQANQATATSSPCPTASPRALANAEYLAVIQARDCIDAVLTHAPLRQRGEPLTLKVMRQPGFAVRKSRTHPNFFRIECNGGVARVISSTFRSGSENTRNSRENRNRLGFAFDEATLSRQVR